MRITAGEFKGRRLPAPSLVGLRPTPAKVRQALFNIIPPYLPSSSLNGSCMLDLFSGSGIMAVEALSRGVDNVTSCEQDARAVHAMRMMAEKLALGSERWQWVMTPLPRALPLFTKQHFTWVFADPPYHQGMAQKIPMWLQKHHISYDLLVVEEASDAILAWSELYPTPNMTRRYGHTTLYFFNRS